MKIHTVTHKTTRRNGKPLNTYKIRYEELVRDPATGLPTGAKRSRSETYPTYEAADARRREIESERAATGTVTGREARLEPFAVYAHAWVQEARDAVALGELKQRTVVDREGALRRYVSPRFAAVPVGAISRTDAREFRSALIARGLAPATVKGAFDAFRRVLEIAVDNGVLSSNPAVLRRKPGGNRARHAAGFEHRPLSKAQLGAVVAAAQSTPSPTSEVDGLVILFLAYTGVRAAELCGLDLGDLRLTARGGTLRVQRTRKRTGGVWVTDTPKSTKSTRRVPLPGWLSERLSDYLETHPRYDDPHAPLFPGKHKGGHTHGTRNAATLAARTANWAEPIEPSLFYKNVLKPALRVAGLPVSSPATQDAPAEHGVRLHDLRH